MCGFRRGDRQGGLYHGAGQRFPAAGLRLCSGLIGYRATTNCRCARGTMSLFNASDRISPDCDRQAMVVRLTPLLYVATLFVSALLLFSIQPMFAKMVLPKLGGAPAVWSVAMVFFQTVLLSGYAYAHLLNHVLAPRWAAMFHLALLGATATMLPIAIALWMGSSAIGWDGALAVRPVRGLDRPAILHAVGQRAAAAKLVRRQRAQPGRQSLRSLRRVQPWLVRGTVRLSRRHRTVSHV